MDSILRLPVAITLLSLLALVGCDAGRPCSVDADCGAGQQCVAVGGVFARGSVCVTGLGSTVRRDAGPDGEVAGDAGGEDVPVADATASDTSDAFDAPDVPEVCDPLIEFEGRCDPVAEVSIGMRHACLRRQSGVVACWGANYGGEAGNGAEEPGVVLRPSLVVGPDRAAGDEAEPLVAADICSAGWAYTCGVSDGELLCWGYRRNLGVGAGGGNYSIGSTPERVESEAPAFADATFDEVVCGWNSTCGITDAGELWCWGQANGGATNPDSPGGHVSRAVRVAVGDPISSAAIGKDFACGAATTGDVYCWGTNHDGILGPQAPDDEMRGPTVVDVPGDVVSVSANEGTACARTADRKLFCWGSVKGIVPGMETTDTSAEVVVPGGVDEVGVVLRSICARSGAEVYCWGQRVIGAIGDGGFLAGGVGPTQPTPKRVDALPPVDRLDVTQYGVCAIADGVPWCWGTDTADQLVRESRFVHADPRLVALPDGAMVDELVSVSGGTAVLTTENDVFSWGASAAGVLKVPNNRGIGVPTMVDVDTPLSIGEASWDFFALGAEETHRLVREWGVDPVQSEPVVPVGVKSVSAIWDRDLAGEEVCWVIGAADELHCDHPDRADTLVAAGIDKVDNGIWYACGLQRGADGPNVLICWGRNDDGQFGNGEKSTTYELTPVAAPLAGVGEFSAGFLHVCAIEDPDENGEGPVFCWGDNSRGQVGEPSDVLPSVLSPREVGLPRNATDVAVGYYHSCAVLDDESIWCWGSNASGQAGGTVESHAPARVPGISGTSVFADDSTTFAIDATDPEKLWCWGYGGSGACGLGIPVYRSDPRPLGEVGPAP